MDRIQAMQIFTRVVETNSFNKAAEALALSPSSVTGSIKNLEAFLGVRLLHRTTRRLNLTLEGSTYYESCRRILTQIAEAEAGFQTQTLQPRGALRIHMPAAIGRLIVLPVLRDFQTHYPQIDLTVSLGDRPADLIQERLDFLIRLGELEDSSFVARKIGMFHWPVCAAPAYISRHGEPQCIEDLAKHHAIGYAHLNTCRSKDWEFLVNGATVTTRMSSSLAVNDADGYLVCGLQGLGLIRPPSYVARHYLKSGRLVEILAPFKGHAAQLSVIYTYGRLNSPAARAFFDWLLQIFADSALLD